MRLTLLASGSGGNALLVEAAGARVLIDGGLRPRKLQSRLRQLHAGLAPQHRDGGPEAPGAAPADAVFLTHEHADHICGAEALAAHGLRLFATAGTARALPAAARANLSEVQAGQAVCFQSLRVHPVALPHDAAEPVAYVIASERARLGVLTDCGHPSPAVIAALAGCDALVLEANHDQRLLRDGPYPPFLKQRIAAATGHLSNDQSAELLRGVLSRGAAPALVIAAHLSRTNNRPALVEAALRRALGSRQDVRLLVAPADGCLPPQDLDDLLQRRAARSGAAAQLAFGF